ncbi:NADH dehydrogenase [ubiquinone] 1 beta subcomplex subunit 3 [Orussus abietinus]|uniref:NADH dehydrogenase [ubiquinone] 1 beta subcomplex subunit 3 n=1 Tax=Orussus abietinus TaxID=222816 RepID=UPI000625CADC|nr:NADH dehydrogenase [ubiquinone] 1 beta subcomplex subunit 3 [Orussus abietinus]XP_023287670.1 NADH dehydrogenase [ubiquinone] 1 beta subcomplex subunit 3 [Orussus abietinus]
MVGHGDAHGHHKPPYVVPNYETFKVEDCPKLIKLQERLAKHGLKDPWVRNEVWRYTKDWGTSRSRGFEFFTRGLKFGFAAFLVTIGIEYALGLNGDKHHGEHGESDKHH